MPRQNGLKHEMHHQRAKSPLIERVEVNGADRPTGGNQRLGNSALLGCHEVSGGMAREILGTRELGEIGRDTRASACAVLPDDGDEMLRRAVEIELKLAVLVHGAEGRDRGCALAL